MNEEPFAGAPDGAPLPSTICCQGGLVFRRRASRLRTGHSMVVVREPVLPECANLSCLTKSVRRSVCGTHSVRTQAGICRSLDQTFYLLPR